MSSQIRLVLIGSGVLSALICLCIFIAQEKRTARQAQLQRNLREAGLGDAPDLANSPRAEFGNLSFDVGAANPLDKVSRLVTVHNRGRKPLKVRVLDQGCSCVAVTVKDEKINPGQAGVIDLTFTAPPEETQVDHAVLLSTNDPLHKQVAIQVTGSVRRSVWTEPRELDFSGLLPSETRQQELRVFSAWPQDWEIARLAGLPDGVEVAHQPLNQHELDAAKAASGRRITITFSPGWTGRWNAPFTFDAVRASSGESASKSVRLIANRLGRVGLSHDRLDTLGRFEIGNIPSGRAQQYTLFLEARGVNKQPRLDHVTAEPAFLKAWLEPGVNAATSGLHRLKFEIPADAAIGSFAGEDQATVTLHFDDPEYPAVTFHPQFHITRD